MTDDEYEKIAFLTVALVLVLILLAFILVGKSDAAQSQPVTDQECPVCYGDDYDCTWREP